MYYKKIFDIPKEVLYSVVMPIYNQQDIIVENIKSIIDNTLGTFEIILILDYCFDNTEKNIITFLENYTNKKEEFSQITIFKNSDKPLFETKCDNIGFKNSIGKYCLEIQADMKMTEIGYNLQLTKPFLLLDNVIAVSGRCAHNLYRDEGYGKLGKYVEKTVNEMNIQKNKFYSYETCNRGPLLLERQKLEELEFLDEENYFLDNSDHDLMARAYLKKKYICGYVPIDFYSPLQFGSTRNINKNNDRPEYYVNKEEKDMLMNKTTMGINKYRGLWVDRDPVIYDI
jgi:glycosyltransferase involved in cell wall biosynthesis